MASATKANYRAERTDVLTGVISGWVGGGGTETFTFPIRAKRIISVLLYRTAAVTTSSLTVNYDNNKDVTAAISYGTALQSDLGYKIEYERGEGATLTISHGSTVTTTTPPPPG